MAPKRSPNPKADLAAKDAAVGHKARAAIAAAIQTAMELAIATARTADAAVKGGVDKVDARARIVAHKPRKTNPKPAHKWMYFVFPGMVH